MIAKIVSLFFRFIRKIEFMVNPGKLFTEMKNAGVTALRNWHEYITNPTEAEKQEDWFTYKVFEKISTEENFEYVDFSFYGKSFRLKFEFDSDKQLGFLKLYERTFMKTDMNNNPIWDFFHIEQMDVGYGYATPMSFVSPNMVHTVPGLEKTMKVTLHGLKRQYVLSLQKCVLSLPKRNGMS